jgi:transposase
VWTQEEFMLGFVGDVGDLAKLVMAEAGAREMPGGRTALEHELADCLWSVLILAHRYDIDLEAAFRRTMAETGLITRLAAIVFVATTGCTWRQLPPDFGPSGPTTHRRFTEWSRARVWAKPHRLVLDELGARGADDGPPSSTPTRATTTTTCGRWLRCRNLTPRIARKGIESSQRLGRHRWTVEWTVAWLAGCRCLHRRYERKAEHFLAFAGIATALMCFPRLSRQA